jgi:hypothetical protein
MPRHERDVDASGTRTVDQHPGVMSMAYAAKYFQHVDKCLTIQLSSA